MPDHPAAGGQRGEHAREVRAQAQALGLQALITDNYHEVQTQIQALQPELILGTQMERHIAKRLGIPCAVISSPVHVQDFPARHSPQMGDEGANVLFDTWIHPLMMGLEEHLLGMFREDFEFHGDASPSHLGHGHTAPPGITVDTQSPSTDNHWTTEAEAELRKIPFFVRGKAKRNTERYASELGLSPITVEMLPEAARLKVPLVSVWGSADPITDNPATPSFVFRLSLKDSWGVEAMLLPWWDQHRAAVLARRSRAT